MILHLQKQVFLKRYSIIKNPFSATITTIPAELSESYYPVLDGFRGIAILIVLAGHSVISSPAAKYIIGNVGVGIFYVLSGFLITTLLLKEKIRKNGVSFKNFYIRRTLRILPVAFLFLIVLAILTAVFNLQLTPISFLASAFYFRNLPLNYGTGTWYNGHFYTLAVEEQFYLIFPVLIVYCTKHYVKIVCAIILCNPILQFLVYHNVGVFYSNFILHKLSLLIIYVWSSDTVSILTGTVLAILIFNRTILPLKKKNYYLSTLLFIGAIVFRNSHLINDDYITSLAFSIFIAYVIYLCLGSTDLLSSILESNLLVQVGILSYSLYVWQQIFTHYQPWANSFKYGAALWINLPLLLIVACLSYYLCERRFLKLKQNFK